MTQTVDQFLLKIQNNFDEIKLFSLKDLRVLVSLVKQLSNDVFLTENQSKLLTKILTSNKKSIETIDNTVSEVLKNNLWSKPFRVIQKVRKIYIDKANPDQIIVEFTYDKDIKQKMMFLSSKIYGNISPTAKFYSIQLTETNVYLLVKEFFEFDFEIDSKILDFYHEIEKIVVSPFQEFDIFNSNNETLKKVIEQDIGPISLENLKLLHDRKIRYQYQILEKISEKSLESVIAQRKENKIFVDSKKVLLSEVLGSVKSLKRFPVLFIFDGHDAKIDKKMLDLVNMTLTDLEITESVGIYYRFNNVDGGSDFNSSVSKLNYNQKLTERTQIVGIANNKIPKFLIKMNWRPQTIISFTNSFRNNKSSAYFSDIDLIVFYGNKQPLIGGVDVLV